MIPTSLSDDVRRVIRQSYAGLLWTKQAYVYDVEQWLRERRASDDEAGDRRATGTGPTCTAPTSSRCPTNGSTPGSRPGTWRSTPLPLAFVDPDFAAEQLDLILLERYQHPNGQLPAYEWNFGDVNPPVHAWACLFNYRLNREALGDDALPFLKRVFHKLLFNFTWWLNRKDREGKNVFEGGFLGWTTSASSTAARRCPPGGYLEQADGTAWMALFCAEHARDGARAGPGRSRPTKTSRSSSTSTSSASPPPPTAWATDTTRCGTKRTASSTTSCASRAVVDPPQGAIDGGPSAAVRRDRLPAARCSNGCRSSSSG